MPRARTWSTGLWAREQQGAAAGVLMGAGMGAGEGGGVLWIWVDAQ